MSEKNGVTEKRKVPDYMAETLSHDGTTRQIDLYYPGLEENPKFIVVGLVDVRAADDIRISYDYRRDGWKIEQASVFEWPIGDDVCDPEWQEVAFVQAWGSQRAEEEEPGTYTVKLSAEDFREAADEAVAEALRRHRNPHTREALAEAWELGVEFASEAALAGGSISETKAQNPYRRAPKPEEEA